MYFSLVSRPKEEEPSYPGFHTEGGRGPGIPPPPPPEILKLSMVIIVVLSILAI